MLFAFILQIAKGINQYLPGAGPPLAGFVEGVAVTLQNLERAIIG